MRKVRDSSAVNFVRFSVQAPAFCMHEYVSVQILT
jgi:hypothetical protein